MTNVIVCLRVGNSEKVRNAHARSDARTPKHGQMKVERGERHIERKGKRNRKSKIKREGWGRE